MAEPSDKLLASPSQAGGIGLAWLSSTHQWV